MGCSGCGKRKRKFKKLLDNKLAEVKKASNDTSTKSPTPIPIPTPTPKQIRIEARNARMAARNARKQN